MGIYIKGMEMPKECFECVFFANRICQRTGAEMRYEAGMGGRNDDCPLVAVPDHGDLIDRDEIIKKICRNTFPNFSLAVEQIKSATVVIQSERSEEP